MKLHDYQLELIRHLARFQVLDYQSCLKYLDPEGTLTPTERSYAFRPLTKNKYLSKRKDGTVTILAKGRTLFPNEKPLLSVGGGPREMERVLQVSRMGMLMERNNIPCLGELQKNKELYFIPSACWRKIAPGILSTTRFTGMLIMQGKKYAVYDIGDGRVDWQVRAESSLFYRKYGKYETRADGMILVCEDECRNEVAKNIIRQTMWGRKQLLKSRYAETNKPVRWSRSPIKLRAQYEHVYLMTYGDFGESVSYLRGEEDLINAWPEDVVDLNDHTQGDCETDEEEEGPRFRYFLNPATDLLKYVYFFVAVRNLMHLMEIDVPTDLHYALCCRERDQPIAKMYQDIVEWERVERYTYQS